VICLIADLTEVRDLEEKVRRRESLAALGTVSAGIAHEIRNALGTILGYARLAEKASVSPAREHAGAIAKEVEVIGRMVDEFLRFARPARLVFTPVDVRGLLDQVVSEAGHAGLLEKMRVEVRGEPGVILGDEPSLRQAFANLVRNASESADRPVRLTIEAQRLDEGVAITFLDDGDGIAEENREQIFLPFFSTKGAGTGIGLALTQKNILEHDGVIEVDCPQEGGTSFKVVLPAAH
jgi:signal transduction histidine kinase